MKLLDQNQLFSKQRNTRNKTRNKRFTASEPSSSLSVIQSFSIQQQLCAISTKVWEVFLALTASWKGAHRVTFHVALLHQRSAPSTNLHALSISQPAIQTSAKIKGKTERMYPYLWILFSSNYSYCYEFLFLCLGDCLHVFSTVRVAKHCKRLPREPVGSPSLGAIKTWLDKVLINPINFEVSIVLNIFGHKGWTRWPPKLPSNLYYDSLII